jgi:hypothetical protein
MLYSADLWSSGLPNISALKHSIRPSDELSGKISRMNSTTSPATNQQLIE